METSSFCSELAAAFLVLGSEESMRVDHHFVIFALRVPRADCINENPSFFEDSYCIGNSGAIRDGIGVRKMFVAASQFICVIPPYELPMWASFCLGVTSAKLKMGSFEYVHIGLVACLKKLLFQCCTHFFVRLEISLRFIMKTVGFNHLGSSDSGRMGFLNARSLRNFEGDSSSGQVQIVGHDDAQIPVGSTAPFASNTASICE